VLPDPPYEHGHSLSHSNSPLAQEIAEAVVGIVEVHEHIDTWRMNEAERRHTEAHAAHYK
jgi:hypothetical protein